MTNKEAIKILYNQRNKFMDEWVDFGGVNEAYNMAIQALEEKDAMIEIIVEKHDNGQLVPVKELVRCKDCYYSSLCDSYSVLDKQLFVCCHVSQIGRDTPQMHTGDWFCAYGQLNE